jgi:hypothetical protein
MVLLLGLLTILAGCGVFERITGQAARKQARAEAAKAQAQELQLKVMRFGDTYLEQLLLISNRLVQETDKPGDDEIARADLQLYVLGWQLDQATAAVQIAAGPRPPANALDMIALVRLNRRLLERHWPEKFGKAVTPFLAAYERLEEGAWVLLDGLATEEQANELKSLIDRVVDEYPNLERGAFFRFTGFAQASGQTQVKVSPGLLGIVGLALTAGLDPAIREFEQTRQLAERAMYYMQRVPYLMELQVARSASRLAASSEIRGTLSTVEKVGLLAESLARTNAELPALITRERQAAIDQVMTNLAAQQAQMLALATELRQALEAGAVTTENLDRVVNSVDRLVARFEPEPGAPPAEPGKPFDVNEYTRLVVELATTARELQGLADELGEATPRLLERADQLSVEARALVDYAFIRLLLLVGAILAAAIAYLLVARRLPSRG